MKHIIYSVFVFLGVSCFGQMDSTLSSISFPSKSDPNTYFNSPDTNYRLYQLPSSNFNKPPKWVEKEKRRLASSTGYSGYFTKFYPDSLNLQLALGLMDTAKEFYLVGHAISWCIYHYEEAFPYLIARLSDKRKIGLTNSADLIIWDRIGTGDLRFYGHGGSTETNEDLFTVAGRASTALNEITGEEFALVHADLTEKQAAEFKQLWLVYLSKID